MKKIALVFSVLVIFLFSFKENNTNIESEEIQLFSNNRDCNKYDSIVTVTSASNYFQSSGVIVETDNEFSYIATSYENYDPNIQYEIVFNDYLREKAQLVGVAKNEGIFLLKVRNTNYCRVNFSDYRVIEKFDVVHILGKENYSDSYAKGIISNVGVCKNCDEETYKYQFMSWISIDVGNNFIGAGVFDEGYNLIGIITSKLDERYSIGVEMLNVNQIRAISYNLINYGKYEKNYIKYNLLNVNSLTKHEKYLYSLDEDINKGVLVSSVHYLNYFTGGLNQGDVIKNVNDIKVDNIYQLDNELAKYKKGSYVYIGAINLFGKYKVYKIKL